jgi:hypothetical protein
MKRKNMLDLTDVSVAKKHLKDAMGKLKKGNQRKRYECIRLALHVLSFEFKDADLKEATMMPNVQGQPTA